VVFGPLSDGDYLISGHRLRIMRVQDGITYSRLNNKGEVVVSTKLSNSLTLNFVPLEPVSGPASGIIECIYLKLNTPIVVDSKDKVVVDVTAPVDYGVIAQGVNRSYNLIDSFPESSIQYKLALYGPPTQGVLCRFYKVELGKPPGPGLARVNIRVVNETESVARINIIVVPLDIVKIFYKPGTWVVAMSDINMVLETSTIASVHAGLEPPSADFDESPDIIRGNAHLIGYVVGRGEFKMIWGY